MLRSEAEDRGHRSGWAPNTLCPRGNETPVGSEQVQDADSFAHLCTARCRAAEGQLWEKQALPRSHPVQGAAPMHSRAEMERQRQEMQPTVTPHPSP